MMYGLKVMGQYHFFKTEQQRDAFISTLPEFIVKTAERWTTCLPQEAGAK